MEQRVLVRKSFFTIARRLSSVGAQGSAGCLEDGLRFIFGTRASQGGR